MRYCDLNSEFLDSSNNMSLSSQRDTRYKLYIYKKSFCFLFENRAFGGKIYFLNWFNQNNTFIVVDGLVIQQKKY